MIRTFRYPLKPTSAQEVVLEHTLSCCQRLYNAALQQRREAWSKQRKSVSKYDQFVQLTELRASEPEFDLISALILRSALNRLDLAFRGFFRRCKSGKKPGYPRFKSRDRYNSFSFDTSQPIVIKGNLLTIPNFGQIKLHLYRPLRGTPKQVHVRRNTLGKWEASIDCDIGEAPPKSDIVTSTGIDVGLSHFATLADGSNIANPRFFKESEELLAKRSRKLARKRKRSNNRRKAKKLLAKTHLHVKNQRLDFARKRAKELVNKYDLIAIEKLKINEMVTDSKYSKSISDVAWGVFYSCLNFKAEEAGKTIVAVEPRGTTQRCSRCNEVVSKTIRERTHDCPHCGLILDRDHNAAINIHALGLSAASLNVGKPMLMAEV